MRTRTIIAIASTILVLALVGGVAAFAMVERDARERAWCKTSGTGMTFQECLKDRESRRVGPLGLFHGHRGHHPVHG